MGQRQLYHQEDIDHLGGEMEYRKPQPMTLVHDMLPGGWYSWDSRIVRVEEYRYTGMKLSESPTVDF